MLIAEAAEAVRVAMKMKRLKIMVSDSKDLYYPITTIDVSAANFSLKLNMAQIECEPFLFSIGL